MTSGVSNSIKRELRKFDFTFSKDRIIPYILQKDIRVTPIIVNDTNIVLLTLVQNRMRGFQRKNLESIIDMLESSGADKNFIDSITLSWLKFKAMRIMCGHNNNIFTYIFKTCLLPDKQVEFDKLIKQTYENDFDSLIEEYEEYEQDSHIMRLLSYFYASDVRLHLPLECFPLIKIKKESKMKYSMFKTRTLNEDELHYRLFDYLHSIDLPRLVIPPATILHKVSSNKYHDSGEVRKDFLLPINPKSGFMYQSFLTQPLTPREVWLPDYNTKISNSFWMIIGRQILKSDTVYPSTDPQENFSRISPYLANGSPIQRFDISGFGFQYQRDLLLAVAAAICEYYPSSILDQQYDELREILQNVSVLMPSGEVIFPPRGIGLGYYEDLKTIGIMMLLQEHHLISVYGDQGLYVESGHIDEHLREGSIIIKPSKIESIGWDQKILWGGVIYTPTTFIKPKEFSSNFIGAIFVDHHWQRKYNLKGFGISFPNFYNKSQYKLAFISNLFFGHEFRELDYFESDFNLGIIRVDSYQEGFNHSYLVEDNTLPNMSLETDLYYIDPYHLKKPKIPQQVCRFFAKKRQNLYRQSTNDADMYRYIFPRLKYNKRSQNYESILPLWADLQLVLHYGVTTGVVTFGLTEDQIKNCPRRQSFALNPFRAISRGGYSILTRDRALNYATSENIEYSQSLLNLEKFYSDDAWSYHRQAFDPSKEDRYLTERDTQIIELSNTKRPNKRTISEDELQPLSSSEVERIHKRIRSLYISSVEDAENDIREILSRVEGNGIVSMDTVTREELFEEDFPLDDYD